MPLHATDNEKKLKVITVMSLLCLLTKQQQFFSGKNYISCCGIWHFLQHSTARPYQTYITLPESVNDVHSLMLQKISETH